MRQIYNFTFISILLLSIYNGYFDSLYGTLAIKIIQILLLIIFIIYSYKFILKKKHPTTIKYCIILTILFPVYLIYSPSSTTIAKTAMICLLSAPFVFFNYKYSKVKIPEIKLLFYSIIPLLCIIIYKMIFAIGTSFTINTNEMLLDANFGYQVLIIIPLTLYCFPNNKKISFLIFIITITCVFLSTKRGAIICVIICCLIYFFYLLKESKKSFFKIFATVFVTSFSMFFLFSEFFLNNYYIADKYEQTLLGNLSGRDEIYQKLFDYISNNLTLVNSIFGNGLDYTQIITQGYAAHNDWLEIFIDLGIIGLLLYLLLFLSFIYFILYRKLELIDKVILLMVASIWIVKSIFSMFLFSIETSIYFMIIGAIYSKYS